MISLAAEYGLKLIYREDFHQVFESERREPSQRQLLTRMEVTDQTGNCLMSNDQWEAAGQFSFFLVCLAYRGIGLDKYCHSERSAG